MIEKTLDLGPQERDDPDLVARIQTTLDLGRAAVDPERELVQRRSVPRLARALDHRSREAELLEQIGYVLKTQQFMVGRAEVEEKPEVLWDHPELERLYARLQDEYELRERSHAIERKLTLIHDAVGTLLELIQQKRNLRLEWYVIILILIEIALSAYQLVYQPMS